MNCVRPNERERWRDKSPIIEHVLSFKVQIFFQRNEIESKNDQFVITVFLYNSSLHLNELYIVIGPCILSVLRDQVHKILSHNESEKGPIILPVLCFSTGIWYVVMREKQIQARTYFLCCISRYIYLRHNCRENVPNIISVLKFFT